MAVGLGVVVGGGSGGSSCGGGGINPCYVLEDYVWVDREGRPTSPPAAQHSGEHQGGKKKKKDIVRKVGINITV